MLEWKVHNIARMIVAMLLNKFDCFIIIEGNRGLGKSTLGYQIMKRVWFEFRKLYKFDEKSVMHYYKKVKEPKGISLEDFIAEIMELKSHRSYRFIPKTSLIYSRDDVIRFTTRWKQSAMADEMINVSFNRDFYNQDQKDLIKLLNMNRDHCNLLVACVPQFQNLDAQIKGLCKIRITVARRGLGIMQTPNPSIYSSDKWDQMVNEKIEREWMKRGKPKYRKLTTFRGMVKFRPLRPKDEAKYQLIKNEKRHNIEVEQMKIEDMKNNPYRNIVDKLIAGQIKNSAHLEGYIEGAGLAMSTARKKIDDELRKRGITIGIAPHYGDKKAKREEKVNEELLRILAE